MIDQSDIEALLAENFNLAESLEDLLEQFHQYFEKDWTGKKLPIRIGLPADVAKAREVLKLARLRSLQKETQMKPWRETDNQMASQEASEAQREEVDPRLEAQRMSEARFRGAVEASRMVLDGPPRCQKCGYSQLDADLHGDHHLCDGTIPKATPKETPCD